MTDQNPYDPSQQPPVPPPPPGYGQGYPPPPPGAYPPPPGYPPPGYPPAGYDAAAPYGRDRFGRPLSNKSKLVAGLLQILLMFVGIGGIGRFYTGQVGLGIAQLLTCGGLGIWNLVDGILLLVKDDWTDGKGRYFRE